MSRRRSKSSERHPVFYDRKKLFRSLFGDFEPEPEAESIIPQANIPFKKRTEFRELRNNVVEKEEFPLMEKEEIKKSEKEEMKRQREEKGEGSSLKSEADYKREKAYEVSTSEGMKFVIKSYKKSEELKIKAEIEQKEKEDQESSIETDQDIKTSGKKRKMKEKETKGDENVVQPPISSTKTWSCEAKEDSSPFMTPKSISFKTPERNKEKGEMKKGKELAQLGFKTPERNKEKGEIKKGKELAQLGDNSSTENVAKKKIRFNKSQIFKEKGKSNEMKKEKELKELDNSMFKGEKVAAKPFIVKKSEGESSEMKEKRGSKLGDNFWFQGENGKVKNPSSSKKPKSGKDMKEEKKLTKMVKKDKESKGDNSRSENAVLIPVICKKPLSNHRKRNPKRAHV